MTIALGWIQIRYFKKSWYYAIHPTEKNPQNTAYITPFQAFLNTLSASLGNGSAAGMATAIASGGPGAAFWIFIVGFFGIALRFVEVYASSLFVDENSQGVFRGGPMVYLHLVPGKKYLPVLYAFFCLVTSFVAGSAMQCNSMAISIEHLTGFNKPFIAFCLFGLVAYILYGGAQRVIAFSDKIIPLKVGLFFSCMAALLWYHAYALFPALILIMEYAFTWKAVAGAGMGYTIQTALRYGISRSVSATELGLGTSGILFGATGGKEPFKNGIMSMASLMISNHLVCCLMLLVFVASGVWESGLTSTALTSAAFETLFGVYGKIVVTLLSISFGLGVLVAYAYIGRECWTFLMPSISPSWYAFLYACMVFFGIFGTVSVVWSAVDIANAGMLIMNLYGLSILMPFIMKAVTCDEQRLKNHSGSTSGGNMPTLFKVACHTDNVGPGSTFVAIAGTKSDGAQFIQKAIDHGAETIVLEHNASLDPATEQLLKTVSSYRVENTRKVLAELSAHAYNHPAKKLKIIGITGTKGKTTTTFIMEHILKTAGYKTARLSTVSNAINDQTYVTQLTTQQPDYLHMFFDKCVHDEVEWVVMEVAAQAVSMSRVHGIEFDAIIFTNFSREHGEFYATQQDYFAAKAALLKQLKKNGHLVLNGDEPLVRSLRSLCAHALVSCMQDITVIGVSRAGISCYIDQLVFENSALLGAFNMHNIYMAFMLARALNIPAHVTQKSISTFAGVPGRLNKYSLAQDITAYIDYAHTPSSMKAVLETLRVETAQLIVVFGAGGNRDVVKRPIMGAIAATYADHIILTTDNPRHEEPERIIEDIVAGIPQDCVQKICKEPDREKAIRLAHSLAGPGAIVLLLGKGPDEYQIIQDNKFYFSEREILRSL